jgi:integrase
MTAPERSCYRARGRADGTHRSSGRPTASCRKAWGWKLSEDGEWIATASALQPIALHEARHSFATSLVRAGYDVKLVSEWIGHAQASTTLNIYTKHRGREGDASALAERMNAYLSV